MSAGSRAAIGAITESATLAVDAKAKALQAAGENVIGFGAGEPDFPTPQHIVEAAVAACGDPKNHHYSPAAGLPELRAAIAAKTARDSGYGVEPQQVLVTNGGKHAVYNTFQALLDPGDEVLLPAPYWTTYPEVDRARRRRVRRAVHHREAGFRSPSSSSTRRARRARRRCCSCRRATRPARCTRAEEVEAIGRWAVEHGIWVITDEIYEHLTYGDHRFASMPVLVPELADTCVVLNGVAKTYAMTGWRVGWMIGPRDVITAAVNLQSHSTSNVANVSQRAALAAIAGDLDAVAEMRAAFERRGKAMHEMLSAIPGVTCLEPQGAFYCFPSFEGVLGREIAGGTPSYDASSCASSCSTRRRWRSCPARRSVRLATRGFRSRSATTTSSRASSASPSCWARESGR